jgi:hypothetical protein
MLERCPHCSAKAAVRKDTGGRLYYICECGGPFYASEFLLENAVIWGEEGTPPDNCPEWIRRGLRYKPGTRENGDRPRAPAAREPSTDAGPGDAEPSTDAGSDVAGAPAPTPTPAEPASDLEHSGADRREPKPAAEPGRMRGGLFI